jgi:hypothetical protein
MMRLLCLAAAALLASGPYPARAESAWLESGRLEPAEIQGLCARVSDARMLARMQMIAAGDARWRLLAREALVIEGVAMGIVPLDPARCYVIARAGGDGAGERRAFEVRDFASNDERTSVLLVGRDHATPPDW